MLVMAVPFAASAEATLAIGTVTTSTADGLVTVTVPYTASAEVEQVTILATFGATSTAPTATETNIVYIDQEAADGEFVFVVDESKFSTDKFLHVKIGGTLIGTAKSAPGEEIGGGEVIIYGDVNNDGEVSATDASLVLQYFVGNITAFPYANGLVAADVNGDSEVSATDASLILQKFVGNILKFPVEP